MAAISRRQVVCSPERTPSRPANAGRFFVRRGQVPRRARRARPTKPGAARVGPEVAARAPHPSHLQGATHATEQTHGCRGPRRRETRHPPAIGRRPNRPRRSPARQSRAGALHTQVHRQPRGRRGRRPGRVDYRLAASRRHRPDGPRLAARRHPQRRAGRAPTPSQRGQFDLALMERVGGEAWAVRLQAPHHDIDALLDVRAALGACKPDERLALVARVAGWSYDEIAERMPRAGASRQYSPPLRRRPRPPRRARAPRTRSRRAAPGGSHQFQLPNSETTAGTSSARMTVASIRIPAASPVARIFTTVSGPEAIDANAKNRISAALVTSRPVRARPKTTASSVSRVWSYSSRMREDEHLVVHREPVEEREHHQRNPGRDRARGRDAPQLV